MRRINSKDSVRDSGFVVIDAGDGVVVKTPVVPERDTGRLTFTSSFPQVTNGSIYFQRVGTLVFATFYDVDLGSVSEFPSFFYLEGSIPEGFVPPAFTSFAVMSEATGANTRRIRFQPNGQILIYSAEPGMRFNVTASWVTLQDWPEL